MGQEQPPDPYLAALSLFRGNDWKPASQSLWVAGTLEGAKCYSCFLPQES